ncbi:hypothetical protein [Aestuariivirga sp.]|uniref:hypothetical protein n=1 Tax=Aestuariivirga sp. TaxID=2650926 RepID=UPI0039E2889A
MAATYEQIASLWNQIFPGQNVPTSGTGTDAIKALLEGLKDYSKNKKNSDTVGNPLPTWATRQPVDTTELLRQLSGNVGQSAMPGGYVGAVQIPAWNSGGVASQGIDPLTYGQTGTGQPNGAATFFQQTVNGGMAPVSALSPLGVTKGWNPFGLSTEKTKDKDDGKNSNSTTHANLR